MATKYNVTINGKKYFKVTKVIGHKADNTPIKKTFYGDGEKDANKKADAYINDIENGLIVNYDNITLNESMHTWLFTFLHNSSKIKPSTFARYEGLYRNYIKNSPLAGNKIKSITPLQIQKYYNELNKKHYSYSQLETLNTFLKVFFNWCIDNSYLLKNPCNKVDLKGSKTEIIMKEKKEVEILSEEEINIIKDKIKGTSLELLILLDLATGLRQGELLALTWNDIDLKNKTININKSVKEVYVYITENNKHIETKIQSPKTKNSYRTVFIPDNIIKLLKKIQNKTGLLFCDENEKHLKAKNVSTAWSKLLKQCNIPHRKFHAIRHTYASLLLKNGVDIETVAELMGHTSISITQIYLHSSTSQKHDAVGKINHIF